MRSSSSDFVAQAPAIPDHEMIRQIGKGSYGEVWLARAVTGALRAVKVVSRADFEYDRTFEREFEGIKKFEPISRKHPGLVDILHVGRNIAEGFYYYVMELADDRISGRDIIPELYVPRTLASDIREKGQLPVDACASWGAVLADALHHLHHYGLAHRDVKPSNVIFVDGVPKLADIGLVAASGQRTFVGTEGFVPPEGPGEPVADIYSLGMVLYEMSTGKDRLEFPAVPQLACDEVEKKKWRRLNSVVCKACAPLPKHRYSNAREMRHSLQALGTRALDPPGFSTQLFRVAVFSGLLAAGLVALRNQDLLGAYRAGGEVVQAHLAPPPVEGPLPAENPSLPSPPDVLPGRPFVPPPPPDPKFGTIKIATVPTGAQVFEIGPLGERLDRGKIEVDYFDEAAEPGEVAFELILDGYETMHVRGTVRVGETLLLGGQMRFYRPPIAGQTWENSSGLTFVHVENRHVAERPFSPEEFEQFVEARGEPADYHRALVVPAGANGEESGHWTVLVSRQLAGAYFDWLTERERREGFLGEDQYYSLDESVSYEVREKLQGKNPFESRVALFASVHQAEFATLSVDSEPSGAGIFLGDEEVYRGSTRVEVPRLRPGPIKITVKHAGYRTEVREIELLPGRVTKLTFNLDESDGVEFGQVWSNSLGMKILPLLDGVMMGAWEVRAKDYAAFAARGGDLPVHSEAGEENGGNHPALQVSRVQAAAFCEWLTELEREEGFIEPNHRYRLPSDREWSAAAGLAEEKGGTPAERDLGAKGQFPWGSEWPPRAGAANIALEGYEDGHDRTAPVGSFEPNSAGFHDLAGNAGEWVSDAYGGSSDFSEWAVVRGGSFRSSLERHLLSSYRMALPADSTAEDLGFRVVLVKE